MLRLPKKIGPFTLMRKLGSDGITEAYAGILDEPAGKQVVVRKIAPFLLLDPSSRAAIEARVHDLKAIRHPTLIPILDLVSDGDDRYIVEEWADAVDLRTVLDHCTEAHDEIPHNVYLNLATQICNGLEALHGRPGSSSGAEHVLHLSLKPESIFVTDSGKLLVGNYGLTATPTALPKAGVSGATTARMEYLSPEQTQPDQALTPASDVFSLGSVLYELLTLEPLFRAESNLQTIHRVRRAEVTAQLLHVKEIMPGLDKVLYRALSLNPRHRYQRAFVLREDLRGLMAGYSFAHITDETGRFLAPLFGGHPGVKGTPIPAEERGFEDTAAILRHSLAQSGKDPDSLNEAPEDTAPEVSAPGREPDSTGAFVAAARGERLQPHNPTISPEEEPSVTEPGPPTTQGHGTERTTWEHNPPSGAARDETTWFPTKEAGASGGSEATPEYEDERPTDVGSFVPPKPETPAKPPSEPAAPEPAPKGLAASVPPPPPRTPADEPQAEVTYDEDDDWPPRRSNTGLYIGIGVAVAVVVLLVCGGVVGGGALFGVSRHQPATVATTEPAPEPAAQPVEPEPAVADAGAEQASGDQGTTTPEPAPEPAAAAPSPRPEAVAPRPAPEPAAASSTFTMPSPAPAPVAPAPRPKPAPAPDDLYGSAHDFTAQGSTPEKIDVDLGNLSAYSDKAYRGALNDSERAALEEMDPASPDYTRALVLLYQDAKARDDLADREKYIDAIMSVPENEYNPQFLTEQAEIAIQHKDWDTALEKANLAERHWARLPSDLIFTRKAMIYEIQASAYQGKFYASGGEDLDSLYAAIRSWEKYQRHVETKQREDLNARAEEQLAKLYDMKKRLEQP